MNCVALQLLLLKSIFPVSPCHLPLFITFLLFCSPFVHLHLFSYGTCCLWTGLSQRMATAQIPSPGSLEGVWVVSAG